MRYKVQTYQMGQALRAYWITNWHTELTLSRAGSTEYWELFNAHSTELHPLWREINDSFVAGYLAAELQYAGS